MFQKTIFSLILVLSLNAFAKDSVELKFSEMYKEAGNKLEFSESLIAADGQTVTLRGYAAPPLKPDLDFFVLTRYPMAVCPFCDDDADWPPDIVLVQLPKRGFDDAIFGGFEVKGVLELGSKTDEETGFVSQIRIIADTVKRPN